MCRAHRQIVITLFTSSQNLGGCGPSELLQEHGKCFLRVGVWITGCQGDYLAAHALLSLHRTPFRKSRRGSAILSSPASEVLRPVSKGSRVTAKEKSLIVCKAWR